MNIPQRAIVYSDTGRTTQPQVFFVEPQPESPSETAKGLGSRLLHSLGQPSHLYTIVTSGTSAQVAGRVCEDIYWYVPNNLPEASGPIFTWEPVSNRAGEYAFESAEGVTGAFLPELTAEQIGYAVGSVSPVFARLTVPFMTANTAPVERRQRDMKVAVTQREQQRRKNKPAIGLLETWLSEDVDAVSEAVSLKETIATLNAERSHSRKLFP